MSQIKIHAAKEGRTKIDILGDIGENLWGEGNSLESVKADIEGVDTPLDVDLSSLGGNAFEGLSVHDLFVAHRAKHEVAIHMIGATASAAVIIASAASPGKLKITPNSLYLAHKSSSLTNGNVKQMEEKMSLMNKIDGQMVSILSQRSIAVLGEKKGLSLDAMGELMDQDKFLTAKEAKAVGLVDEVSESNIAASVNIDKVMASDEFTETQKEMLKSVYAKGDPKSDRTWLENKITEIKELITTSKKADKPVIDEDEANKTIKNIQDKLDALDKEEPKAEGADLLAKFKALQDKVNRYETIETPSGDAPDPDPNASAQPVKSEFDKQADEIFDSIKFPKKKESNN